MQNYFYSIVAGIALVVHLVINWRQLVARETATAREVVVRYSHFLIFLAFFFVFDTLWGVFAALKCPRLLYADTVVFFLLMALSVFAACEVARAVLKAMLARSGVPDVVAVENGREALEVLRRDPNFELVFSDLWMPEMDGRELVRAIRADEALSHLPVYLVSADVEARHQADSDGFTGVLLKPITLEKLRALFG